MSTYIESIRPLEPVVFVLKPPNAGAGIAFIRDIVPVAWVSNMWATYGAMSWVRHDDRLAIRPVTLR